MHEIDMLRINHASPAELMRFAKHYGLRQQGQKGYWQVRKETTNPFTGQRVKPLKLSSGTPDLRDALIKIIPRVEAYLAAARSRHAPVHVAGDVLTLAKLASAYLSAPNPKANLATRQRNIADLTRIVARVLGHAVDPATMRAEVITYELGEQFLRLAKVDAEKLTDLPAQDSAKRSANATLAHAQSLFSKAALANYRALRLPTTMREFSDVMPLPVAPAPRPQPIDAKVISEMLSRSHALLPERAGLWAAFVLMLRGGMRNIEALNARRSWMVREEHGWRIRLEIAATRTIRLKGTEGGIVLPFDVGDRLRSLERLDKPAAGEMDDPHLVPAATSTARHNIIYRELNAWLAEQGVAVENGKIAYRLRKEFGRRLLTQEMRRLQLEDQALQAAQVGLRHAKGSDVTRDHYIGDTGLGTMTKPVEFS